MNSTERRVVVLGVGTSGELIARRLVHSGVRVAVAGRRPKRVLQLAEELSAEPIIGLDLADPDRLVMTAQAVVNTAGPFTATAASVLAACLRYGVPYLDIANELGAIRHVLGLDHRAKAEGVAVITGAGYGPAVTESLLLQLLTGSNLRCEAVRSVTAPAPTPPSPGVQATVAAAISAGTAWYTDGVLRQAPFGTGATTVAFGGRDWAVLPAPIADLELARRITAAPNVTAYFAPPDGRPVTATPTSYARIEVDTSEGQYVRTCAVGLGVEATAAIASAAVTSLLGRDRMATAGVWTPGALFGPVFAADAAGLVDLPADSEKVPG